MAIRTNCPTCGDQYNLADDMAGKNVQCKGCENAFVVEPWMYPNMACAPLISGGRTVREYQIGEFQAKLMTEIEPLFPEQGIRYTHILYTYRAVDDPIFIVAAETNVYEPEQTHCGLFTPSGRQNLGVMESWANLETFAAEANSLACKHLGIALDDERSSVEMGEREPLSTPLGGPDDSLEDFDQEIAEDHYHRGNAFHEQEEYEKAIAEFSEAIRSKPDYAEAYVRRGFTYEVREREEKESPDYTESIADYTVAIRLNPVDAFAYFIRGTLYSKLEDTTKAEADFAKAMVLKELGHEPPEDAHDYLTRGIAFHESGEYEAAIADYTKSIDLEPTDAVTYYNRGLAYNANEEYEKAIGDYNKSIELDPTDADTYQARGNTYYCQDEYEKAIGDYNKSIELDPTDADTYQARGNTYYCQDEYERAVVDYTRSIAFDPIGAEVYAFRGFASEMLGDEEKAAADLAKAKELGYEPPDEEE